MHILLIIYLHCIDVRVKMIFSQKFVGQFQKRFSSQKPVTRYYKTNSIEILLKMIKITLLAILCLLSLQQTVLIASKPSNTNTVPPQTVVAQPYHTANYPNYLGSGVGAQWLWKVGQSPPSNGALVFEAYFFAECTGTAELKISADFIFSASVNGGEIMTGNDWKKVYSFKLNNLVCGSNRLQVKVTIRDKILLASAVIFAVVQDQSACKDCQGLSSYFNSNTCQCECISEHDCGASNSLMQWADYPTCGCKCKSVAKCASGSVWNKKTCKCECKPKACPPGQVQNSNSCECINKRCPKIICLEPFKLDPIQCECVCAKDLLLCEPTQILDENKCKCTKKICPQIFCSEPHFQDPISCKCVCPIHPVCEPPLVWDNVTCSCIKRQCPRKICIATHTWDPILCKCVCAIKQNECPPQQHWDVDQCRCIQCPQIFCSEPRILDPQTCQCTCPKHVVCRPPLVWDQNACKCSKCVSQSCPEGKIWDSFLCRCTCINPPPFVCRDPQVWNEDICKCDIKVCLGNIICEPNYVIDYDTCTCVPQNNICERKNCGIAMTFDTSKCSCVPIIKPACKKVDCGLLEQWNTRTCACQSILK